MQSASALIFFDGVCNLCNGFVQFVIKQDPAGYYRFAALQSEVGQEVLRKHSLPTQQFSTVLLLENGQLYSQSTAALRILRRLGRRWSWLYFFIYVPGFLRDPVYAWISRNRYRWFGRQESCMVPTPELKSRFL